MNGFYQQEKPGNFSSLGFFFFFYTDFKYNICFNACFFSHRVHSEIARNILDEAQACLPPPIQFLIVKLKRLSGSQAYCL